MGFEGLKLLGIALACIVLLAVIFAVLSKTGALAHPVGRGWFGFVPWTGVLVWMICKEFKSELRRVRFWITFLSLLSIHVIAFVALLLRYPEFGLVWFVPITILEALCMDFVLEVIVGKFSHRAHKWRFRREEHNSITVHLK